MKGSLLQYMMNIYKSIGNIQSNRNMKVLKKDFADEEILLANQYMWKYLTSFIITELPI